MLIKLLTKIRIIKLMWKHVGKPYQHFHFLIQNIKLRNKFRNKTVCVCVYIYIYKERGRGSEGEGEREGGRERERERDPGPGLSIGNPKVHPIDTLPSTKPFKYEPIEDIFFKIIIEIVQCKILRLE